MDVHHDPLNALPVLERRLEDPDGSLNGGLDQLLRVIGFEVEGGRLERTTKRTR